MIRYFLHVCYMLSCLRHACYDARREHDIAQTALRAMIRAITMIRATFAASYMPRIDDAADAH